MSKKTLFKKIAIALLSFMLIAFLDFIIATVSLFSSTKPRLLDHFIVSGQLLEVYFSGQGAMGRNVVTATIDGELFGRELTNFSFTKKAQINYSPDSIIVTQGRGERIDTCVVHRMYSNTIKRD